MLEGARDGELLLMLAISTRKRFHAPSKACYEGSLCCKLQLGSGAARLTFELT